MTEDGVRTFIVSSTDKGGIVVIVSSLLATWSILCMFIRIYTRWTTKVALGIDDLLCLAATILASVASILFGVSVKHGFGKAARFVSAGELSVVEKYQFAATMLALIAMTVAKCTLVCFYLRITPNKVHRTAAWLLGGLSCAAGIAWIGILAGRCAGSRGPWEVLDGQCSGYTAGWTAIAATDVALEVLIFLMPVWIVWDLQMALQMKIVIILTFAMRLPIIAVSLAHLYYARRWYDLSEGLVAAVVPYVCLLVELHFSIMSSTFPTLGPFMKSLNTRWGAIDPQLASSYALDSLSFKEGTQKSIANHSKNVGYQYRVKGETGQRPSQDSGSNDSSRMIIHRTTETRVEYDKTTSNASPM